MRPIITCILALCAITAATADSGLSSTPIITTKADSDWESLSARPESQRTTTNATAPAGKTRQIATLSDWEQKLGQARAFQTSHPDDSRCINARKIELTALLKLQQLSGQKPQPSEDAGIDNFIQNTSIPAADRYDISALAKSVRAERSNIKTSGEARALHILHARELAQEFPQDPRGYGYLLAVAKSLPAKQAVEIAHSLLASGASEKIAGGASEKTKTGARSLLAQKNLEGKKLQLAGLDMDAHAGRPVIIYTWTVEHPHVFEFIKRRCIMPGVAVIGINIDTDTDTEAAQELVREVRPPGEQYYDSGGMDGPIASQLHLQTAVSVYIIDAEGRLVDTLGHENTAAKLQALLNTDLNTNLNTTQGAHHPAVGSTEGGAL